MPPFPLLVLLVRGGGVNVAEGKWARGQGPGWEKGWGLSQNMEQKKALDGGGREGGRIWRA